MTAEMMCKLDWFSFTFPIPLMGEKDNEYTLRSVLSSLRSFSGEAFFMVLGESLWEWQPPFGFYTHCIKHPGSGLQIAFTGGNRWAIAQLSGSVVDYFLRHVDVSTLASSAMGRCARIDFAVDFETSCTPEEFAISRQPGRITTISFTSSQTGDTYYIGSRSGERMARVYRYNPPHPRSNLLRAEVELKGDAAKIACSNLITNPLTWVCLQAHAPFAWQHPLWQPGNIVIPKVPARYYDRNSAGYLRWVNMVVIPSLVRSHREGVLNLHDLVESVLEQINN